jgi:hypothetical protein
MSDDCNNCRKCLQGKIVDVLNYPFPVLATRMILCPSCGNKRCPKATDHRLECTGSNEPGQKGSAYE